MSPANDCPPELDEYPESDGYSDNELTEMEHYWLLSQELAQNPPPVPEPCPYSGLSVCPPDCQCTCGLPW